MKATLVLTPRREGPEDEVYVLFGERRLHTSINKEPWYFIDCNMEDVTSTEFKENILDRRKNFKYNILRGLN